MKRVIYKFFTNILAIIGAIALIVEFTGLVNILFIPDISGDWELEFKTIKTAYNPYLNMSVSHNAHIKQDDRDISIIAETTKNNDEYLSSSSRTVINGFGKIKGNILTGYTLNINYVLSGKLRDSTGSLILKLNDKKALNGSFNSTAANSSGHAFLRKL
ncbi:MAG: hypothetical protein WAX89_04055 [Alphaproteobacteria bacterium]